MTQRPDPYSIRSRARHRDRQFEQLSEDELRQVLRIVTEGSAAKFKLGEAYWHGFKEAIAHDPHEAAASRNAGPAELIPTILAHMNLTPDQVQRLGTAEAEAAKAQGTLDRPANRLSQKEISKLLDIVEFPEEAKHRLGNALSRVIETEIGKRLYAGQDVPAGQSVLVDAIIDLLDLTRTDVYALVQAVNEGRKAKDRLINAFLPLIENRIGRRVQEGDKVGLEDRSDLLQNMIVEIDAELSELAEAARDGKVRFSTLIIRRVFFRLTDQFRRRSALKRNAAFDSAEDAANVPVEDRSPLDQVIHDGELEEMYFALDQLPEDQQAVILSSYGLESGKALHMREVAKELGIRDTETMSAETVARNAYRRAMYKLRKLLGPLDDSDNS